MTTDHDADEPVGQAAEPSGGGAAVRTGSGSAASLIRSPRLFALTLAYSLSLLATLSLARRAWDRIGPVLGAAAGDAFLALGLAAIAGVSALAWRRTGGRARRAAVMAAVAVAYVLLLTLYYGDESPAKKFHLVEYGVLAYLALSAVRIEPGNAHGAWVAGLIVIVVSLLDETIQGMLPQRFFAWGDILGNLLGGALGGAAWVAGSPSSAYLDR